MIVLATATCLFALPLAGCSSSRSGMPNIYLSALSYQQQPAIGSSSAIPQSLNATFSDLVGDASMTVRAGYFGVCIRTSIQDWNCRKDAKSFAAIVNVTQDPLDLVSNSMVFRESIIFSGLLYVTNWQYEMETILTGFSFITIALGIICVPLLATLPLWHAELDGTNVVEVKPWPSRALTKTVCGILAAAVLLALISSLWQHIAAVAFTTTVRKMAYGSVKSEVGTAAIAFAWVSLALYIFALCAMLVMTVSLRYWTE